MDLSSSDVILACDRIGIVAFSIAGVEAGLQRRLDVFGLLVVGIVTAGGGGVIRDVMLDRTPLLLEQPDFLLLALAASVVAVLVAMQGFSFPGWPLHLADAVGLGAFSVAGAFAAIQADLPLPGVVCVAIVTANGGGVVRDLLINRLPGILQSELRATAAAVGAIVVWSLEPASTELAGLAGLAVAAGLRYASLLFDIHLPIPMPRSRRPEE